MGRGGFGARRRGKGPLPELERALLMYRLYAAGLVPGVAGACLFVAANYIDGAVRRMTGWAYFPQLLGIVALVASSCAIALAAKVAARVHSRWHNVLNVASTAVSLLGILFLYLASNRAYELHHEAGVFYRHESVLIAAMLALGVLPTHVLVLLCAKKMREDDPESRPLARLLDIYAWAGMAFSVEMVLVRCGLPWLRWPGNVIDPIVWGTLIASIAALSLAGLVVLRGEEESPTRAA